MTASLITFANLGRKQNFKTMDILPVIEALSQKGDLTQVICQLHSDFYFKPTLNAVPSFIWYPLRIVEKLLSLSVSRPIMDRMFDYFAQFKLAKTDTVIFHGGAFLPRTFRRARSQGSITVDLTVTSHPETNARLEKEESSLLGLAQKEGAFSEMNERGTHCNEFDYVIAMSEFVKNSYLDAGFREENIFIAHPDIDTERFMPRKKSDKAFRVVYVAYTTPLKGLHYLLDAWEALSLSDAELVLVGGYGAMPDELKQRFLSRISKLSNIVWAGNSSAPETQYQNASLLVFPSLTEGFGRVTIEAMACGIPVITTENARGIVEDGKTGFIVPIRDAQAIKEKIEYLYQHQEIAAEMGREARKAAENKKPFGEAVYEIYQDILKKEGKE